MQDAGVPVSDVTRVDPVVLARDRIEPDELCRRRLPARVELEAGRHVVSLGPPYNYTPEEQTIILKDTSELEPREVSFDLLPDA